MEAASTNVSCDMDIAFLCDDGHVLGFEVSECDSRLDDVSVTSQVDSAFDEDDTMCELEKYVNDDVSFRTFTRLRSMFNDGRNVDAIADDSAIDSFMTD
ncbi:hypothetical protein DPMN_121270 [Dreissena polymorpha]|uniref:Uncharacterized protein n=1 Tax=Dreissena polymorpha TaxID=45954 RepID=A0A9D4JTE9_DREPO|nr:hypothetical protein DPMN_121270 [Dreissena polymorpha]